MPQMLHIVLDMMLARVINIPMWKLKFCRFNLSSNKLYFHSIVIYLIILIHKFELYIVRESWQRNIWIKMRQVSRDPCGISELYDTWHGTHPLQYGMTRQISLRQKKFAHTPRLTWWWDTWTESRKHFITYMRRGLCCAKIIHRKQQNTQRKLCTIHHKRL